VFNCKQRSSRESLRIGLTGGFAIGYRLAGMALALILTVPTPYNPLSLPVAHAHHGGGGAGGGGGPSGGGGGGGETMRKPPDGYGKGGRGVQGMKS